jgi:2-polyprenyl-3-methyl-5-hydroxy-6-metoxy-1,4-benzoquinol methylase
MQSLSDKKILDSWNKNVTAWVKAIQTKQIESRELVTDQAIIDAVLSLGTSKILDIGCGEGWLVRELAAQGLQVTGIDAVQGLVDKARQLGDGTFTVLEYENISASSIDQQYDLAICNFSLLGKESVEHLFKTLPSILNKSGYFIIQTLHPNISCGELGYVDGWREGSWAGFSDEFSDPAPWYFRTIGSWLSLFINNGFRVEVVKEPLNPKTGQASSLLIVASVAAK